MLQPDVSYPDGEIYASVGDSDVDIYDPSTGDLESTLDDGTDEPYTTGSAFDSHGNFYVTDDTNGEISEYDSSGDGLSHTS